MSATDFSCMNVAIRILLQRPVILAKDETGEDDSLVAASTGFQTVDVLLGVRRIANDQQTVSGADFLERLDHEVSVVLGLESRDVQDVPVWLHSPLANQLPVRTPFDLAAVSNHCRRSVVTREVIVLNHLRVRHHLSRKQGRQILSEPVITASQPAPLFTFMFEAVDIDCYGCTGESKDGAKRCIRAVADERCVVALRNCMNGREKSVNDSVEIRMPDRRQNF